LISFDDAGWKLTNSPVLSLGVDIDHNPKRKRGNAKT
jgi:hypothetical protein